MFNTRFQKPYGFEIIKKKSDTTYAFKLVTGFPSRWPEFNLRSGNVGFVVDKVALGQVFSEYFSFPCQFSFH
jgi:hypothetical protein